MAAFSGIGLVVLLLLGLVDAARFGGRIGGIRSSAGRSSGGFFGGSRSSGGRYSNTGGSAYSGSRNGGGRYYSGNYGRSSSSGGFGLGLGGGLLLGYSMGRLSGPGYGYGYGGQGHSYGQNNRGYYDKTRYVMTLATAITLVNRDTAFLRIMITVCDD